MTLITPGPASPFVAASSPFSPIGLFPNTTPFTYRDGSTFAEMFEQWCDWVEKDVIPEIVDNVNLLAAAYNAAAESLRAEMVKYSEEIAADRQAFAELVDAKTADLQSRIDIALGAANAAATRAQYAQQASEAAATAAQGWAANTQVLQDTAVQTLIQTASSKTLAALKSTIDKTFVGLGKVENKTEAERVASGDIAVALGTKYDKKPNGIPDTDMTQARQDKNKRIDGIVGSGTPDLTGVNVTLFGHSWVASPTGGVQQYLTRAFNGLRAASVDSTKSQSGYRAQDCAISAYSGLSADTTTKQEMSWIAGTRGVVAIDHLLNNLADADTAKNRAAALEGTRALVAMIMAERMINEDDPSITYTGTWAQRSVPQQWGTGRTVSGTQTTSAAFSFPVKYGKSYIIAPGIETSSSAVPGSPFEVARGTQLITRTTNIDKAAATNFHPFGVMPNVVATGMQLPNFTDERVTVTKNPGGWLFFDGLLPQLPEGQQPLVFLMKPLPVTSSGYQNKASLAAYLRTVPDTVAAEFGPNVIVLDAIDGWNTSTMLLADGLHPSEAGAVYLSNFVQNAVQTELTNRNSRVINKALGLI